MKVVFESRIWYTQNCSVKLEAKQRHTNYRVRAQGESNGCKQQNLPKLQAEDETAVHRFAALPLRDELEKGYRIL